MTEITNFQINWQVLPKTNQTQFQIKIPLTNSGKRKFWQKSIQPHLTKIQRCLNDDLQIEISHYLVKDSQNCLHQDNYFKRLVAEDDKLKVFFYCCECGHEENLCLEGSNANWQNKLILGHRQQEQEINFELTDVKVF